LIFGASSGFLETRFRNYTRHLGQTPSLTPDFHIVIAIKLQDQISNNLSYSIHEPVAKMVRTIVIGLCAFVSLGALIFGMDGGYFSGVLAMQNFIEDFGTFNQGKHAYEISAGRESFMNSFPYLGQLLAALGGGLIADLLGRKWGLVIMVMTSICGVLMQLFARHEALLVTGRFVNCKYDLSET